jgi:hypothetical protein
MSRYLFSDNENFDGENPTWEKIKQSIYLMDGKNYNAIALNWMAKVL